MVCGVLLAGGVLCLRCGGEKTNLVCFDVCAEADAQGACGVEHGLAVPPRDGYVEDGGGLGDIVDVFADVELAEFLDGRAEALWD